jgi:hypothetical protein
VQTIASGDSCPAGTSERFRGRLKPQPKRH